ncbi:helix-turn-helix domain-containing protein [Streptosporangium sp. NPDC000509]|uniref:helix-turn-helix domain-containing protein n=1 Tax=Streptosporangium sp. NPDC000509 TaxID=3366186 RepID=UPI0036B9E5A9
MTTRRQHLAERRRSLGYTQESFAEHVGADRSTIARWERGECEPLPFVRPKLAMLLQVTPAELDALLNPSTEDLASSPSLLGRSITGLAVPAPGTNLSECDDMNRRELLRLLSVTGTLVALPQLDSTDAAWAAPSVAASDLVQYEQLNAHLWQVFSLSPSKRLVYPVVGQQLRVLATRLEQARTGVVYQRLCALTGDLFQLAGEIFFDGNRYTDAAHCYTLAVDASKAADAHDLWACALTRHAFISMYERRFAEAVSVLSAAARVAVQGDSHLSTRHWVAAVQAQAFAGLGDLDACNRALEAADEVLTLTGPGTSSGWLRFDGSRLAEERGTCYLELGRADLAEGPLFEALGQAVSLRQQGSVLTDLAMLGIQRGDLDQALHYGGAAITLAEQTQSAGYVGRKLQILNTQLAPFMADNRVAQFTDHISRLARIA